MAASLLAGSADFVAVPPVSTPPPPDVIDLTAGEGDDSSSSGSSDVEMLESPAEPEQVDDNRVMDGGASVTDAAQGLSVAATGPEIVKQSLHVRPDVKPVARLADMEIISPRAEVPSSHFYIEIPTNKTDIGVKPFESTSDVLEALSSYADPTNGISDQSRLNTFLRLVWPVKTAKQRRLVVKILMSTSRDILVASTRTRLPELLYRWLKAAAHEFEQNQEESSVSVTTDILKLLIKYPVDFELLRQFKLGHVVKKLSELKDENVRIISNSLIKRWRDLVPSTQSVPTPAPKREAESQPGSGDNKSLESVAKKPKTLSLADVVAQRKQAAAAKMAQSVDMSSMFQTEAKPKKRPSTQFLTIEDMLKPSVPKPLAANQLNSKVGGSNESIGSTVSSSAISDISMSFVEKRPAEIKLGKNGRPQKRVTWAPEGKLARIKIFESDEIDRAARSDFLQRDDKSGEGNAMKRKMSEEPEPVTITWRVPKQLYVLPDYRVTVDSPAAKEQSIREQNVLAVLYFEASHIPPSPAEPEPEPFDQNAKSKIICLDEPASAMKEEEVKLPSPPVFNTNMMSNLISTVATHVLTAAPSSQPSYNTLHQPIHPMQHAPRPSFVNQPPQFLYQPPQYQAPVINPQRFGMIQGPMAVVGKPAYKPFNGMPMPAVRPTGHIPNPGPVIPHGGAGWPKQRGKNKKR